MKNQSQTNEPLEVPEHLSVSQKLAKVDVKQVAGRLEHDVVVVPVADAEDVGGHAVAGARGREVLDGALVLQLRGIVLGQPLGDRPVLERARQAELHLDLAQRLGVRHHLDHAALVARRHAGERDHLEVEALLQPELVHYADHLDRQHVLLEIVADLLPGGRESV